MVKDVSFSSLRDIFVGRIGADYCAKALLFLRSPNNVKEYLAGIHKIAFPRGDADKVRKWSAYTHVSRPQAVPIVKSDLLDPEFLNRHSNKLSFDISRLIEFLVGYTKVDEDIRPIMLHYSMIYLFDFFSRTWLKYDRNRGHGIKLRSGAREYVVQIGKSGIFPKAVDAFYFIRQSSLFSTDDDDGIDYQLNIYEETISKEIEKLKYSECPEIGLTQLIDIYTRLGKIVGIVSRSNPILVGYVILFIASSISRYRAEDWFKIREDRNLRNKFDLLQYDFLYEWTPEIMKQTILREGLRKELSISDR